MPRLGKNTFKKLTDISLLIRKRTVITSFEAKIPHLGSCLSCVDILVYLYFQELSINPEKFEDIDRDRFLLSKGHAAPVLFQVLAEKGFFSVNELKEFGENGSVLHEHPPKPGIIKGIEAATGSLGHGFPMGIGMAISAKIQKKDFNIYALLSDGECNEGSIWEGALLAPKLKLDNFIGIIDYNKWQATGRTKDIMNIEPFVDKWLSFGWHCQEIDGHNFDEIHEAFLNAHRSVSKPSIIIANTIKGKGISFMEDDNNWHYRTPNNYELESALAELSTDTKN